MAIAVQYRWKIRPGTADRFVKAWSEATREIRECCASYSARLHRSRDGTFVSYACWPSEKDRQACLADAGLRRHACFSIMEECVEQGFDEEVLTVIHDGQKALPGNQKVLPTIKTRRLCLRPLNEGDAEALEPALTSADNMRYWSSGALENVEAVREYIQWNIHGEEVECFAIARIDQTSDALGWVVLIDGERNSAELGFIVRPDSQGHGYAKEAARAVILRAFGERGFRRLMADVDPDNVSSIALIESLGFQYEGRARAAWETHIGVRDSLIYGMTAEDVAQFNSG